MRSDEGETWYDDDAGPLVPLYAVTGGRTHAGRYDLDLITLVVAVAPDLHAPTVEPEYAAVLWACVHPSSVAEVASAVQLPLEVAKVLISDLVDRNYIMFRSASPSSSPDLEMMQRVLTGLRNL
ncbi:DUF742 domain-containing protein [Kibdelosporangium aridum]|uniref:DUF742 domain-containing protein n=1 Tax=Kibdelosporangium aridum TaxID=2030 RepID=A0A428ZDZ5_KIBAR|nr:DUF742 domain-containing protein [Kibdelosporangium aridum]RSM86313.1 DUF742 domain-containing protein [Kibdelosporangium aridum]